MNFVKLAWLSEEKKDTTESVLLQSQRAKKNMKQVERMRQ